MMGTFYSACRQNISLSFIAVSNMDFNGIDICFTNHEPYNQIKKNKEQL